MSICSNCYNGCTEIVSDRCVKYTGIDVPVLGIQTGDSLSYVEQALITFLTSTLDGTGVKIDLAPVIICDLVKQYLPTCKDLSIVDVSKALVQAACDLQEQVDDIVADVAIIEADYNVNCLTGVTASSGTHAIVQAVINKLCQVQIDLTALALDLSTNYVQISDLDDLIQDYIDNSGQNTLIKNRMVPFAVVPYYGPITYFNGSGAGTGDWDRIFLCNGNNGTPDLRGRTLVGVTDGTMLGGTMAAAVDPTIAGNPNYSIGTTTGANQITLNTTQIPNHTHIATVSTIPNHTHYTVAAATFTSTNDNSLFDGTATNRNEWPLTSRALDASVDAYDYELTSTNNTANAGKTSEAGGHTHTVTNAPIGEGLPHSNIQPSIGCRYIIYIP
jgi:microcystin-dependent protein